MFRSVTSREWDPRRRRGPASSHPWLLRGLRLTRVLEKHAGCVNAVAWNDDASLLLSGSDDLCVCVWGTGAGFPLRGSAFTGHRHNIFSAEFVPGEPNGARCVTVAGDGDVRLVEQLAEHHQPVLEEGVALRRSEDGGRRGAKSAW